MDGPQAHRSSRAQRLDWRALCPFGKNPVAEGFTVCRPRYCLASFWVTPRRHGPLRTPALASAPLRRIQTTDCWLFLVEQDIGAGRAVAGSGQRVGTRDGVRQHSQVCGDESFNSHLLVQTGMLLTLETQSTTSRARVIRS